MSNPDRDRIARDVEEYLKRGGKILEIPPGVSGEDDWLNQSMQWHQEKRKRKDWEKRNA